jgi:thiol-disulfide isomerase/thioredoxin
MKSILAALCFFSVQVIIAQTPKLKQSIYRAVVYRPDSNEIIFNLKPKTEKGKTVLYVINDTERLRITDVKQKGDSLFFSMPVFESSFLTKINKDGSLQGTWVKGTSREPQQWPFKAIPGKSYRFPLTDGNAKKNISGKWAVTFINSVNGKVLKAIALFKQQKNKLTGSFLTPSGDYRYLDGVVTGDSLKLSTFDGSHAYYFTAKIDNENQISGGRYFAGYAGLQTWTAVKDDKAPLPEQDAPASLKPGETGLNFAFNDSDDKLVSIKDERFSDKVVIVQIMGSWCPNCMDETKFLSEYYRKNKNRGIEIVALAYEYSTDLQRSKASLRKFQQRFHVEYPMLITGVTSGDEQRTEKTLPQLTPIRSFPTTIFIDKKGNVRKIEPVFYGPGTGDYYQEFLKEFNKTVDGLLGEK